jgi:RNase H-fold protein (predicted Holliday junction resolvase)
MSARSIYQKVCPSCSTLVALDTGRCKCGYSFEDEVQQTELLPEEQAAQEELLKEYLNARVSQALAQMETIQAALVNEPKNLDKANKLMQAFSEVRELRAEIEAQSAKVAEIRNAARAELDVENSPSAEPAATPAASSQPTQEFSAAQATTVEKIMHAAGIDTKECPKCHAVLPERAALCFCGYAFARNAAASLAPIHAASSATEYRKNV